MYLANAIDSHHHTVRWFGTAVCFKLLNGMQTMQNDKEVFTWSRSGPDRPGRRHD